MKARLLPAAAAMRVRLLAAAVALTLATLALCATPTEASASIWKPVCGVLGAATPLPLNPCTLVHHGASVLHAGGQLASGNLGGIVQSVAGGAASVALGAVASWATAGARFALDETAHLIASSTRPRLAAPWFTVVYWRFAGVAALLTVPFLFAAALQSLIRSDLSLLARSAFGYLPLAMLGVGVAAQLTALLLAATDELCAAVSGVAGNPAPSFLVHAGADVAELSVGSGSPFLAVLVSAFTVAGAIVLWLELVVRAAAVYVIVVMLPLAFAALVWPARRVWALRAVELLVALILSKLAIIAVLTLGGAALEQDHTAAAFLTGLTLLLLGAFAPWAMLRFVPFAELAAGAAGRLRAELVTAGPSGQLAQMLATGGHEWARDMTGRMRRDAHATDAYDAARSQVERHVDSDGSSTPRDRSSDAELVPAAVGEARAGGEAETSAEPGGQPSAEVLGQDPEGRVSLLPHEVGPNGERRPGMSARWQAANRAWRPIHLGIEDGWSPVAFLDEDYEEEPR